MKMAKGEKIFHFLKKISMKEESLNHRYYVDAIGDIEGDYYNILLMLSLEVM